jgi:antitoxin component of MazEF toxin-antitoxin module
MSTRKLKDKNIRKLTRVGKTSISVTIPIEIVKDLKWKERQKVVVKQSGKKIIIQDWEK